MSANQLIPYYPTYALLDETINIKDYKNINLYIDLKNVLQSLYQEHHILNIISNTKKCKFIDTSIFTSLLLFLSFHKLYCMKRGIKINFYIFFETGVSFYHLNIDKDYKKNRKIEDLFGLDSDKRELFFNVIQKNLELIDKALNLLPNIYVINSTHLEADFIPYYLISRQLINNDNNTCNLIYSNDHDLYQTLSLNNNIYQFIKTSLKRKIIKSNQIMSLYLKEENNYPDSYFPLSLAILGDLGDNVKKIKGLGPKNINKIMNDIILLINNLNDLYNNVFNNKDIFNENVKIENENNKFINLIIKEEKENKLISKNLKLTSFEIISKYFDDPSNTEMIERKNKLLKLLNNKKIIEKDTIEKSLKMNNVDIPDNSLDILYDILSPPFDTFNYNNF